MNTFLIFIILLIFIYEFTKRIKYINNQSVIEKFEDIPISKMTYLPSNFTNNFQHDLNIKDISEDLGVKRSINQVISSVQEDIPNNFFKPLDINLFRKNMPKWTVCQRPWIECYTILDPIIDQKNAMIEFKNKNPELLSIWEKNKLNDTILYK
jgi:hypothetical protein